MLCHQRNDFSFSTKKMASDVENITADLICSKGVGSQSEKASMLFIINFLRVRPKPRRRVLKGKISSQCKPKV